MAEQDTFSVEAAAERMGVSAHWYGLRLRDRTFPGRKIGRKWRVTEQDFQEALESTYTPAKPKATDPAGLTKTSRRRLERSIA